MLSDVLGDVVFLTLILILIFGISAYFITNGLKIFRRKLMTSSIPTSKARSVAVGLAEIKGVVIPYSKIPAFKSPLTGTDCVYCRYTVERWVDTGKHADWSLVEEQFRVVPFYIKDDSGMILVDPIDADIEVKMCNEFFCESPTELPRGNQNFHQYVDEEFKGEINKDSPMRFREYFITLGDLLYVIGRADENKSFETISEQSDVNNLVMTKNMNPEVFYISDKLEKQIVSSGSVNMIGGVLIGSIFLFAGLFMIALYLMGIF